MTNKEMFELCEAEAIKKIDKGFGSCNGVYCTLKVPYVGKSVTVPAGTEVCGILYTSRDKKRLNLRFFYEGNWYKARLTTATSGKLTGDCTHVHEENAFKDMQFKYLF